MTMMPIPKGLRKAFDPQDFQREGEKLIQKLGMYLHEAMRGGMSAVLPDCPPEEMLSNWRGDFSDAGSGNMMVVIEKLLHQSNHLHHPGYIGHQCCTVLPMVALVELVGALLNNASAVYEMGPVNVAMEKRLIQWMAGKIGYDHEADGFFTHGGTLGNLTALLAARQSCAGYDVWESGIDNRMPLAALVSEQCHYSIKRAFGVMGMGESSVYTIPVDDQYCTRIDQLEPVYRQARKDGKKPFVLIGNACSTATGSFDDLSALAQFAGDKGLWLHVDAAHGASVLLSDRYRHLIDGLQLADSMVWDAHKMMMIPALATAVVFKKAKHSYRSFSKQHATYLFQGEPEQEWYNYAHRTMECTKSMLGLKIYVALEVLGEKVFGDFIDHVFGLARAFSDQIEASSDFELAVKPQSNIVCFRHIPQGVSRLDTLQQELRREILKRGRHYIVQTKLSGRCWLRCTIINPLTSMAELSSLLDEIRAITGKLIPSLDSDA